VSKRDLAWVVSIALAPLWLEAGDRAFERIPENAAGAEALQGGVNPWLYWGTYQRNPRLVQPPWRDGDDVVVGWDWSLPPAVKPSSRARLRWGFGGWKDGKLRKAGFPDGLSCVDEVWWSWRKLEPEEGQFDFNGLKEEIHRRIEAGCRGVIIRLLGSVWETGTPEQVREWQKKSAWRFNRWSAPRWLERYDVRKIEEIKGGERVVHADIFDPIYHEKYLRLVKAFGASGLPALPELHGLLICGMSFSNGEEAAGVKFQTPEQEKRWRERLQAWIDAFGGEKRKLIAMGDGPAMRINMEYGLGSRDGYVEMYLYHAEDRDRGQYIDARRYLCVDESNPFIANPDIIFGDENEEYSERQVDCFGPIESFNYRYFTSMLRFLQMRRNYLYTEENAVLPDLLWYVCHAMARTVQDTPDAWCFLRESYVRQKGTDALKNFERRVYQRDREGFETQPAVRIPHAIERWWLHDPRRRYDYVARTGKRIGFAVDDRFVSGRCRVAVKVSFYDGFHDAWRLVYTQGGKAAGSAPVECTGTDGFRTATFFIDADFDAKEMAFDLEIHSGGRVPISFVRLIRLQPRMETPQQ